MIEDTRVMFFVIKHTVFDNQIQVSIDLRSSLISILFEFINDQLEIHGMFNLLFVEW